MTSRLRVPTLVVALLSSHTALAQSPGSATTRPVYRASRADEDWSRLSDSSRRASTYERLKVHGLGAHGALSFGGDARLIEERYRNEDFGRTNASVDHSLAQRYAIHTDLQAWTASRKLSARLFVQLKSGIVAGRDAAARVPDVDTLDLQQAFTELSVASKSQGVVRARVGRQELVFGSQRLIGLRDFPNVRQSFDLARVTLAKGSGIWTIDLFGGSPSFTRTGVFDDKTDYSKRLWGVYATRMLSGASNASLDMYYVGHQRDHAATHLYAGAEMRHTVGARWTARLIRSQGTLDTEVEPMIQFGALADEQIRAWSLSAVTGWRWTHSRGTPRFSIGVDASSGDRGVNGAAGTYHPLYATGGHMALGSPLGAVNFISLHPKLERSLSRKLVLSADWFMSWRESGHDGLYNIAGAPLGKLDQRRDRWIGHRPGIHIDYALNAQTGIGTRVTYFSAGPYLRATGWKRSTEYATVTAAYRF